MLLNEFIYFDKDQFGMKERDRYDPANDTTVVDMEDLRKSRLTLKMINRLRKAGDAREKETKEDLELVRKMYATPQEPGAAAMPM
jgi:hypothetical protein